jgi:HAD superfamily hydrolase (TIGR01490 family)
MRLALFDLDNTLLACDSDYEWGQFLVDRGILGRDAYEAQNRTYYEQYVAGTLDIHEYLGFALRPLAAHTAAELEGWHAEFMRLRIRPMISAAARALVKRHAEDGELCAIITATNSFITTPIAREFGVAHLIATEPESKDGRFTGRVRGIPSSSTSASRRTTAASPRLPPRPTQAMTASLIPVCRPPCCAAGAAGVCGEHRPRRLPAVRQRPAVRGLRR